MKRLLLALLVTGLLLQPVPAFSYQGPPLPTADSSPPTLLAGSFIAAVPFGFRGQESAANPPLRAGGGVRTSRGQERGRGSNILPAHLLATITDSSTGVPVAGAQASLPALGLSAASGPDGIFEWRDLALPGPVFTATIRISAPGFGLWTIHDVRLLAGDTLLLDAELGPEPVDIHVPPPRSDAPNWPDPAGDNLSPQALADALGSPLPETIRVRVTGFANCDLGRPYTVETVDFRQYLKHVLPNEWIASWQRESLRAGAMAAKMYAWYWIARGGKWNNADVYDSTCDQVYNPAVAYASTNSAVDHTWNWRLTRAGLLFQTSYRAFHHQCLSAGLEGRCLGQWDSQDMAVAGAAWSDILAHYYWQTELATIDPPIDNFALRFFGNQLGEVDVLRVRVDDPATTSPGPPVDVGAADFTLEWWMQAGAANDGAAAACGPGQGWLTGARLFDRDRAGQSQKYGVSLSNGVVAFGVAGDGGSAYTLCGQTTVSDGAWHHVAVARRRSDGALWVWVDGRLDAAAFGPPGDISDPDAGQPAALCGRGGHESCGGSDPYLFIGGAKRPDGLPHPSYAGLLDDVRFSTGLRYRASFRPAAPLAADSHTAALYNFDDAGWTGPCSSLVADASLPAGGPSGGLCRYGGSPKGPLWVASTLRATGDYWLFLPFVLR